MKANGKKGKNFPANLIVAVKLLRKDFLRFIVIIVTAIICGSPGIAVAYGWLGGIVLIESIIAFVLIALYINRKMQSGRH